MEETRTCLQADGGILEVGFDERVGIGADRREGMGEWLARQSKGQRMLALLWGGGRLQELTPDKWQGHLL